MSINEDYLWDRSGEPDPVVQRLEDVLSTYRHVPLTHRRRSRWPLWAACAVAIGAVALIVWPSEDDPARMQTGVTSPYEVAVFEGVAELEGPGVDGVKLVAGASAMKLPVGTTLRTPKGSRVVVRADDDSIGVYKRVTVSDPERDSELRLQEVTDTEHRLYLARGRLHAMIGADVKMRLFQVGTPSGLSVDLGCEYDLVVDDDGSTTLEVSTGGVDFVVDGRSQVVPAGFRMWAPKGGKLSPPLNVDTDSATFRAAVLGYLDPSTLGMKGTPSEEELLADALKKAKVQDALTLYYLWLARPAGDPQGKRIYDRLIWLESLPGSSITEKMVLDREPWALERWRVKICGW